MMDSLDVHAIKQRCRGIALAAVLLLSAFFGFTVFSPLFLAVFALKLPFARFVVDSIICTWFALAVATFETVYGIKVTIQGDVSKLDAHASSIIVLNHRTRLDWLFFASVQARYGSLRRFKISLKDMLRHAPGAGWAMQAAQFLFMARNWERDKNRIEDFMKSFEDVQTYPQLLFFPEGTDLQPQSLQRSQQYAKKNDLPEYHYVLHPRTTGFSSLVQSMQAHNDLKQVIDATIAYPRNICQDESHLLAGDLPREIVFKINCYNVDQIDTSSEAGISKWLEQRWREKEDFLRGFYQNKGTSDCQSNGFTACQNLEVERVTFVLGLVCLSGWITCIIVISWAIVVNVYCFWMFIFVTVINTAISTFIGFDKLYSRILS
ncbi:lysocardiolipin acyltransferase 1-like [Mya arenaria]|uniref:lysocardiolipin acyltransferase 1-like n=1 Tax=Mya arenaria TaxID=6604 RepID=UPI0022E92713|nr:lysocardiolipin acyltransferase 1-like [Mya arenaria]XP_052784208.1 lysocardiolipin acyltransferase 1-like [Mya arenaria]XP_052784209.1 lysocardiolipin acyltransferase 1-like [Mya arenaria]XP_052784210.1 lysocardiolipin acyltransferase 1-like [Mya arenaria]